MLTYLNGYDLPSDQLGELFLNGFQFLGSVDFADFDVQGRESLKESREPIHGCKVHGKV